MAYRDSVLCARAHSSDGVNQKWALCAQVSPSHSPVRERERERTPESAAPAGMRRTCTCPCTSSVHGSRTSSSQEYVHFQYRGGTYVALTGKRGGAGAPFVPQQRGGVRGRGPEGQSISSLLLGIPPPSSTSPSRLLPRDPTPAELADAEEKLDQAIRQVSQPPRSSQPASEPAVCICIVDGFTEALPCHSALLAPY